MIFRRKKTEDNIIKAIYKKDRLLRYMYLILGVFCISMAYNLFIVPSKLLYGMGGVGIILKELYDISPSLVILVANSVLMIVSFIFIGKDKTTKSVVGALLVPLMVELTSTINNYVVIEYDPWLYALFGSVLTGVGLGFVFKTGYTTGGTDILNQIVSKYGKMSIGNAMIWTDGLIILAGIAVVGWTSAMYSVIVLAIISFITDKVILGISSSKSFYIITDHETEVKKFITRHLDRGVTVLDGRGGYTGNHQKVIMCIIPTKEYFVAKEGIHSIDPNAFFLVTDAYEVSGGK